MKTKLIAVIISLIALPVVTYGTSGFVGIGVFLPSDEAFDRYDQTILTLSFGGEMTISDHIAARGELEYINTGSSGTPPRVRYVEAYSSDFMSLGGRLGLTWYPFQTTRDSNAIYFGAGGTFRHIQDTVYVPGARSSYADEVETSDSAFGPHFLIGTKLSWFHIEAIYDIMSMSGDELPYDSVGGLVIKAGFIFTF